MLDTALWGHCAGGTRCYGDMVLWGAMGTWCYGDTVLWGHGVMGTQCYGDTVLGSVLCRGAERRQCVNGDPTFTDLMPAQPAAPMQRTQSISCRKIPDLVFKAPNSTKPTTLLTRHQH